VSPAGEVVVQVQFGQKHAFAQLSHFRSRFQRDRHHLRIAAPHGRSGRLKARALAMREIRVMSDAGRHRHRVAIGQRNGAAKPRRVEFEPLRSLEAPGPLRIRLERHHQPGLHGGCLRHLPGSQPSHAMERVFARRRSRVARRNRDVPAARLRPSITDPVAPGQERKARHREQIAPAQGVVGRWAKPVETPVGPLVVERCHGPPDLGRKQQVQGACCKFNQRFGGCGSLCLVHSLRHDRCGRGILVHTGGT